MPDPYLNALSSRLSGQNGEQSEMLTDFPPTLIEVTLERVVTSTTFRRSQRHRRFLEHVVRATLAGRREQLKEVIIGLEIFGRTLPGYDPRHDPIVRVEAGRIREKLARYYDREGSSESFQFVIPVGHYQPRLVPRRFNPQVGQSRSHALAVLPFVNLSSDPGDAAFGAGLANQIIDTIGRAPGLRVVARLSASKARDAGMDPKSIGKILGVDHVIDGTLQRSGTRLRCIAQVSRTKDNIRVWSQRFEHDAARDDDLFDFQDAIADAVLAAVSSLDSGPDGARRSARTLIDLLPPATGNREARDLFERARHLAHQRTYDGYTKAIGLFERALALDPSFGQAYSQLGTAHANRLGFNRDPTFPTFTHVERAARKALELDPLDGEARALLAVIVYRIEYRWLAAEPIFQEALRLAPNSPIVHSSYAWALVFNGHVEAAMRHTHLSQQLDPLNLGLRANNAAIAMYARLYDFAIDEFQAVLQLEPDHFFSRVVLGITYLSSGKPQLALPHFEHASKAHPDQVIPTFCTVCADALLGRIDEGRRALDALVAEMGNRHYSRINRAMAETCLGDHDRAFASLAYAADEHDVLFVSVTTHALFTPLRTDARYHALLAKHGLLPPVAPPADWGRAMPA